MSRIGLFLSLAIMVAGATHAAESLDRVWRDVDETAIQPRGERLIVPSSYRTLNLDWAALDAVLDNAPRENSANAFSAESLLSLPLPDGGFGRFRILESPIMA